jgi:hypothetical protein
VSGEEQRIASVALDCTPDDLDFALELPRHDDLEIVACAWSTISIPSSSPRKNGSTNLVHGRETMKVTVCVWFERSVDAAKLAR